MSIITISSIFNFEYDDYKTHCNTVISDFITTTPYEDTLDLYIYLPIWLRYRDTPIKFSNDDKGKDAFLRNFNNQLTEVVFDFHNYAKENIDYFLYQNDTTKQGKPMSKTITSGIAPINQKIDQAVDSTNLASGTGSQFVSETVYNGVAWHKLVEGYFTPNRKTALLKAFQWLFISVYSPETKYDDKIEEKREVDLSFVDEDNNIIDVQEVYPSKTYFTMSEVDINRPATLEPQNIKKDVDIAGVVGTFEVKIYPRIYDLLRLDIPDGEIVYNTPSGYDGIEGVTITIPDTAIPENIKQGVNIGGIVGSYEAETDKSVDLLEGTTVNYASNDVTTLKAYAFYNMPNLETVDLPNVTTFQPRGSECHTFEYCTHLKSINFPNLTTVSRYVFNSISGNQLGEISFPKLTAISRYFISFANGITKINFGALTAFSETYCISNTATLTEITISTDQVCILNNVNSIPASNVQHITIYVPSNLITSYQTATNWSTLYNNGYVTFVAIS